MPRVLSQLHNVEDDMLCVLTYHSEVLFTVTKHQVGNEVLNETYTDNKTAALAFARIAYNEVVCSAGLDLEDDTCFLPEQIAASQG